MPRTRLGAGSLSGRTGNRRPVTSEFRTRSVAPGGTASLSGGAYMCRSRRVSSVSSQIFQKTCIHLKMLSYFLNFRPVDKSFRPRPGQKMTNRTKNSRSREMTLRNCGIPGLGKSRGTGESINEAAPLSPCFRPSLNMVNEPETLLDDSKGDIGQGIMGSAAKAGPSQP